jgi:uncharacterized protein YbgA (DUF1722 family)
MGNLIAKQKSMQKDILFSKYGESLVKVFSKAPRCSSNINVMQHIFGHVSKKIKNDEKKLFLNSIEDFKNGRVGISVPISFLRSWITRFEDEYLKNQTFFNPYPEKLIRVESMDICSARDYFK